MTFRGSNQLIVDYWQPGCIETPAYFLAKAYLSTPCPHILKCKLKCIYEKKHFVSSKVSLSSGIKIFPFYCNFLLPSSSGTVVREAVFVTSDSQSVQFVLLSPEAVVVAVVHPLIVYLPVFILLFCHIEIKYIHKIQMDEAKEPMEANKAYEKGYL